MSKPTFTLPILHRRVTPPRRDHRPANLGPRIGPVERLEDRALLSTIVVQNLSDSGPGSLRAAIEQANAESSNDTIAFSPSLAGTINLSTALPALSTDMLIVGPGQADLIVARSPDDGIPAFTVFSVSESATVTVSSLTITGGFGSPYGIRTGGGIDNAGHLTLLDTRIIQNKGFGTGGGVYNTGVLEAIDTTISHNWAASSGGGILNMGTATLTNVTLDNNNAGPFVGPCSGGGICNYGTIVLVNSTVSQNEAAGGTFSIHPYPPVYSPGSGNGIYSRGSLTIIDSTISQVGTGSSPLLTVSEGTAIANGTIFNSDGAISISLESGGSFQSKGYNLFSDIPAISFDGTDQPNTDPLLYPLADNGGPTATMALMPGSPAIDTGTLTLGIDVDQRGQPRPQGSAPDIGAFESPYSVVMVQHLEDTGPGSLRGAIEQSNMDMAWDIVRFAPGLTGTITLMSALPDLSTNMLIIGPGSRRLAVTQDNSQSTRIFTIPAEGHVFISGLAIVGSGFQGGGIYSAGTLVMSRVAISNNTSVSGGAILNDGQLRLSDSTVSNNNALTGAGIYNTGTLDLENDSVSGNTAGNEFGGLGGGIYNVGSISAKNTTLSGNRARGGLGNGVGGGIYNQGTMSLANSTVTENSVDSGSIGAGPVRSTYPGLGANIYTGGKIAILSSTICRPLGGVNRFADGEGEIYAQNSICTDSGAANRVTKRGAFVSGGHNLLSLDTSQIALDPTDLISLAPLLGPLADNGGPTWTIALLPGSPAIDAGVLETGISTDQRGVSRPRGYAPDIGAFESSYSSQHPPVESAQFPAVLSLQRFGVHMHPTRFVVSFSRPMDPESVRSAANYILVSAGVDRRLGTADDRLIPFRSIRCDASGQTVTLQPVRRLPLRGRFLLTIKGDTDTGLKDTSGLNLDGAGTGQEGTNYVARITARLLVRPIRHTPTKLTNAGRPARHRPVYG